MKKWSWAAIKFIKDSYRTLTDEQMAEQLRPRWGMDVSPSSVQRKRHRLGYIKPQSFRWGFDTHHNRDK